MKEEMFTEMMQFVNSCNNGFNRIEEELKNIREDIKDVNKKIDDNEKQRQIDRKKDMSEIIEEYKLSQINIGRIYSEQNNKIKELQEAIG